MLEDGSKAESGSGILQGPAAPPLTENAQSAVPKAPWFRSVWLTSPWLNSPWLAIAAASLATLGLGGLILAAAMPEYRLLLWPGLERQYWLVAALSVLVCLVLARPIQFGALRDLLGFRAGGALILALGADAALAAGILCGPARVDPWHLEIGIAAFFLADGIAAGGLLGRRLMAGRVRRAPALPPAAPAGQFMIEPGQFVPCDGVVIAGRSEVDDGPVGGAVVGSVRLPGDTVQRGARNGDGRLLVDPMVEAPVSAPDHAPAQMFGDAFQARALLVLAAMVAVALVLAMRAGEDGLARAIAGLLVLGVATPLSLGLVRPLVYAKARSVARRQGWHLNGTAAIEELAEIDALACGRGGVLTRIELEIVAIHPAIDIEAGELVAAATSIAQSSRSVWARTLLNYAVARKMRLAPIVEWSDQLLETGFGLRATTQGGQVLIAGTRDWVTGQGIRTSLLENAERESLGTGRRALWVAQVEPAPILIGVIVAGERIKPGTAEMCKNAKRFGLTGALLDRKGVEGGAELARYCGLRFVEDDTLARKAMETEWNTARLRPAIAQHFGDPLPDAPVGPRLLLGARLEPRDGGKGHAPRAVAGGWTAANPREDPRLILDLLMIARATRRRERFGTWLAYLFAVPGLLLLASGTASAALLAVAALAGLAGVVINAQLLGLVPTTAAVADEA